MFYTGGKQSEDALVQRVGLATSSDLMTWEKHDGNPIITADPTWYEILDLDAWHDHAWRDPYVFQHPQTGDFHAFITARTKTGPTDGRGVIGHARSRDLLHWEVLPPVTEPGEFGHMEVPQVVQIGERWALLFSVLSQQWSQARLARLNGRHASGTHYLLADDVLGPYHLPADDFLQGDAHGSLYSGKLVHMPDGSLAFMAFENMTPGGEFVGALTDPIPVRVAPDGQLSLEKP
jgi:beta-fructofuranosidase